MALKVLHISGLSGHDEDPAPLLVTVTEHGERETFVVTVPRGQAFVSPGEVALRFERSGLKMADLRARAFS